ncbi:MAG TPA: PA2779 family protein, partial [Burkholderiales bacterium]|nr:PA2779 family protein [Burkholderiales bacterium]
MLRELRRTRDSLLALESRLERWAASRANSVEEAYVAMRRHGLRGAAPVTLRREQDSAGRVESAGGKIMMTALKRVVSSILIVCTLGTGIPLPATAAIIATDQVIAGAERDRVKSFLDRAEVQERLQALGVDRAAARARVDALSDQEIATLADQLDRL